MTVFKTSMLAYNEYRIYSHLNIWNSVYYTAEANSTTPITLLITCCVHYLQK